MIEYITGTDHYNKVLARVAEVKRSLWIGTADIKDVYVNVGETTKPFLAVLDDVWIGRHCKTCKRRALCPDPIA